MHTLIAAPLSTKDGRTSTGKSTRSTNSYAFSTEVTGTHSGWSMPRRSHMSLNFERSSAHSMSVGAVPKMRTWLCARGSDRLFGICPPTLMITPSLCSAS